jgi:hypothetical protein
MHDEHARRVEDARDLLRTKIDLELRKHRRRMRKAGEGHLETLTTGDFDAEEAVRAAWEAAERDVYALPAPEDREALEA